MLQFYVLVFIDFGVDCTARKRFLPGLILIEIDCCDRKLNALTGTILILKLAFSSYVNLE
jgi:hypothetical protein